MFIFPLKNVRIIITALMGCRAGCCPQLILTITARGSTSLTSRFTDGVTVAGASPQVAHLGRGAAGIHTWGSARKPLSQTRLLPPLWQEE